MIELKDEFVTAVVAGLKQAGVNFISSLSSTGNAPVIRAIMKDADFTHVPVAHENDAIGIAAGAWLAGKRPAVMLQNSGLIMATYALLDSLSTFGGFPMLLFVDHRGSFGDELPKIFFGYGLQLPRILENFLIPYTVVSKSEINKLTIEIRRGMKTAESYGKPAAILVTGEVV